MNNDTPLLERLRKVERHPTVFEGSYHECLRNPDGPEAADTIARLRDEHARRVTELLEANNREVERRRAAEAQVAATRAAVVEECAKVADAYLEQKGAIVRATDGDDDGAANACWHARQIADRIRALNTEKPHG